MITQETKQRILDVVQIEEVIGDFITLKKRGSNYIACCPFHNEKTPSFVVTPSKGIFKCFGCGKSGDAIRFVMEYEHYSYPDALRYLAKKYNIEIEEEKPSAEEVEKKNERDGLFHVNEYAQKMFADILYNDEMGRAVGLSYLHERGLSDEIIRAFGLGYCLDDWRAFTDRALRDGYSDDVLGKTGLTIYTEEGKKYDRFRGRVMFPIYSVSGRVLGFSGRILTKDKNKAKYVNSPSSDIYDKSRSLYGLFQARDHIRRADKCYLVEGNVDVVSMHMSGVRNTVASCGTSFTDEQVQIIKRLTQNITVLYDGDAPGISKAIEAVKKVFKAGLHARVVLFPDGEDPDSFAQKYGSQRLQDFLAEHEENFVLFKARVLQDEVKRDPIKKTEAVRQIVDIIACVPDLVERQEYISICASKMNMPEQVLQTELVKAMGNLRREEERQREQRARGNEAVASGAMVAPEGVGVEQMGVDEPPMMEPDPEDLRPVAVVHPDEIQERKIISLLLNYGQEMIEETEVAEDGTEVTDSYHVAAVLAGAILGDNLRFDNPMYQRIFDIFVEQLDQESVIDGRFFVEHPDEELRDVATTMMVDEYHVSELWVTKRVYVPKPESRVKKDVDESLLSFKERKLIHKMEENARRIKEAAQVNDQDELLILLNEKLNLDMIHRRICQSLSRVITS